MQNQITILPDAMSVSLAEAILSQCSSTIEDIKNKARVALWCSWGDVSKISLDDSSPILLRQAAESVLRDILAL